MGEVKSKRQWNPDDAIKKQVDRKGELQVEKCIENIRVWDRRLRKSKKREDGEKKIKKPRTNETPLT